MACRYTCVPRLRLSVARRTHTQGKLMETYARSIKICAWCKTKGYYAMKKGGRYLWVFAAISIVTLVPLIFEVEREVQTLELEELQVSERAHARTRARAHPRRAR